MPRGGKFDDAAAGKLLGVSQAHLRGRGDAALVADAHAGHAAVPRLDHLPRACRRMHARKSSGAVLHGSSGHQIVSYIPAVQKCHHGIKRLGEDRL